MDALLLILLTVVQMLTACLMGTLWGTYVRVHHLGAINLLWIIPMIIIHVLIFTKLRRMVIKGITGGRNENSQGSNL